MKITRLNRDRDIEEECSVIKIEHNGSIFTIKPEFDRIEVMKHEMENISIMPGCKNVFYFK